MKEKSRLKIPITIRPETEFNSENMLAESRLQIEITAIYIQSIFNLIDGASHNAIHQEYESSRLENFLVDVQNISKIGVALSNSLLNFVMPVMNVESDIDESNKAITETPEPIKSKQGYDPVREAAAAFNKVRKENLDLLAIQLSEVLNYPHLPKSIHNGIMRGLNDVENETDSNALEEYTTSPDYLKKLFADAR